MDRERGLTPMETTTKVSGKMEKDMGTEHGLTLMEESM